MNATEAAHEWPDDGLAGVSGASIVSISCEAAEAFLATIGERGPDEAWVAFGALHDDGTMIGVAVLGASVTDDGRMMVGVAPDRRRMGVGTDLLKALSDEATRRKFGHLRLSYPESATTDSFLRSCGLVTASQVVNGTMTAVLFLPPR